MFARVFETATRVWFSSVTLQPLKGNTEENDRFNISQLHEILLIKFADIFGRIWFSHSELEKKC